jgi:hypothetical protein
MEYEKCFQPLQEKGASRNIIIAEDPNLVLAVDSLVRGGRIVGQGEMLSADVIYFLNPENINPEIQPVHLNGTPMYLTPEERLKRPTDVQIKADKGRKPIL